MGSIVSIEEWLEGYRVAWVERDPDKAAALFTPDGTYQELPFQDAFLGQAGVRDYWERVTTTQSDIEIRYGVPIAVGNRVAVEWWTNMRNKGADVTLAGSFMLRFAPDGRCAELREYWAFKAEREEPRDGWGA